MEEPGVRRPLDLAFLLGWVFHMEVAWEQPKLARFLRRLEPFSQLLLLDRRGSGLWDPADRLPTLEERGDDVRALMDAASSQRAALLGTSKAGPMRAPFAATSPERTAAVVRCNTFARNASTTPQQHRGTGTSARVFAPPRASATKTRAGFQFEDRGAPFGPQDPSADVQMPRGRPAEPSFASPCRRAARQQAA